MPDRVPHITPGLEASRQNKPAPAIQDMRHSRACPRRVQPSSGCTGEAGWTIKPAAGASTTQATPRPERRLAGPPTHTLQARPDRIARETCRPSSPPTPGRVEPRAGAEVPARQVGAGCIMVVASLILAGTSPPTSRRARRAQPIARAPSNRQPMPALQTLEFQRHDLGRSKYFRAAL